VVTGVVNKLVSGQWFDLPGAAENKITVAAYVELFNEGTVTAFVELPPGAIVVNGVGERPDETHPHLMRWSARLPLPPLTLVPDEHMWLLLENGRTVAEWARSYQRYDGDIWSYTYGDDADEVPGYRYEFTVREQFVDGVTDRLVVDALVLPLVPKPGSASGWQSNFPVLTPYTPPKTALEVGPTVRSYGSHVTRGS
jgi:hypothetical protein